MLHVFKRSRNAHITFIFGHFEVYAFWTSDLGNFLQKNHCIFISRQETISGMKLLDLLSIPGWLQLSRMLIYSKYLSFIDLCIPHFAVERASEIWLRVLWKMVLFVVCDFQNGGKYRMLRNVSIDLLLFYKNNVMLKTDIMLDYW